eukprot:CAMPEP_0178462638 /NCGR_PEP_ID=MMETSP0689_2-20121128/49925_1 /TAXON_ID=160604 /ORGANISM="Amphidinium massartii, Strain CS-259" /LENGTH=54 /DNA_ID=CAMNT_0020089505 /DNA_START=367 /DNA_END=527 /DNA_ORIENTATION=+
MTECSKSLLAFHQSVLLSACAHSHSMPGGGVLWTNERSSPSKAAPSWRQLQNSS